MKPWSIDLAGRYDRGEITSELLATNPLGDPATRPILTYLPPGYDTDSGRRYPTIYVLQGYSSHLGMAENRFPFRTPFPELVDELFADPAVPPAIVVFVDAWTAYGGSQFLDSPGTGRYHSYFCDEVVPWIDARYRTIADRDHRAVTGKSSGGYGAMITPMTRPDLFGALATHAGDALFDVGYRAEIPWRARALRDQYDGSYDRFLAELGLPRPAAGVPASSTGRVFGTVANDLELIEVYAYAAAYSTDEDGTVRLPYDGDGVFVPEVWDRWLANDPVHLARTEKYAEAIRSLNAVWIDAGKHDEYFLDIGATAFHHAIRSTGLPDDRIHFELFDAGHGAIEYRYPLAIRWLANRMS